MADEEMGILVNDLDSCKNDIFAAISDHILCFLASRPPPLHLSQSELACLCRLFEAGSEDLHKDFSDRIAGSLDGNQLALFQEMSSQEALVEECKACKQPIPLDNLLKGSCVNGHSWRKSLSLIIIFIISSFHTFTLLIPLTLFFFFVERCSLGYQVLDGIATKKCEFCNLKQFDYHGKSQREEWSGDLGDFLRTCSGCIYCGGDLSRVTSFRLR